MRLLKSKRKVSQAALFYRQGEKVELKLASENKDSENYGDTSRIFKLEKPEKWTPCISAVATKGGMKINIFL